MKSRWIACLMLAALLLAAFACTPSATISRQPQPPQVEPRRWAGEWLEEWPNASEQDSYRINVTADGYTLTINPLTRADRQQIQNVRWSGATLSFSLLFNDNPIEYAFTMDPSGNALIGTATLTSGEVKNITWRRVGSGATAPANWPPKNRLTAATAFAAGDWASDWEEDWSESSGHDRYQVSLLNGGMGVAVQPLNAVINQQVRDLQWNGTTLNFELAYGRSLFYYELVPQDANTLDGLATNSNGDVRRIRWRRIAVRDPNLVPEWAALWREQIQDAEEPGVWEIKVVGQRVELRPLTNVADKQVRNVSFDGQRLFFSIAAGPKAADYALTMTSTSELSGTLLTDEGQRLQVTWKKFVPPAVTSWTGLWEEHWPGNNNHDYYRVAITNGRPEITPLTNVEKQRVSNVRLDGAALCFGLRFNEADYEYQLILTEDALAVGSASQAEGNVRSISWNKMAVPARTDLTGSWDEAFGSGSGFHDRFQLRVEGNNVVVKPLTNLHKQKISNVAVSWPNLTVTFKLEFGEMTWNYRLVMVEPKRLIGSASNQEGQTNNLVWTRTNQEAPVTTVRDWAGSWAEQWPNSNTTDVYTLIARGNEIIVKPKTKVNEQVISLVKFENGVLRFHLNYQSSAYDYHLTLQDKQTISGTVINSGNGQLFHVQWNRMQE